MTLITISFFVNVLAILVQTCKSEIPGLPNYKLAGIGHKSVFAGHHNSVVYVPICTPECIKSSLLQHHHHQQEQPCHQEKENLGGHQQHHEISGSHHHHHHQNLGSAIVHQENNQHVSEHKQTIHHHGSGVSHQNFRQEHSPSEHVHHHHDDGKSEDHSHDKNVYYKFEYSVDDHKTGDVKLHKEERKGDVVNGEYSLLEHDGNVRTVKYQADWKTGFHAQVHNSKPKSLG